jgi:ketosteroid isomerase-like protein
VTDSANLDLVRSILADWERGEFYSSVEWVHPQIEFVYADGPDPGSWKGAEAMATATRKRLSAWERYHLLAEEFRELDRERVLVFTRRSGRGKSSGMEVGQFGTEGAWLFHIHDSRVTRLVAYFDRENALADLGLAPEADSP